MTGLEIHNVSVEFDSPIINGVSFRAPFGHVTALIGPNGAGKSTLLSAIAGLVPFEGELLIDGHPITHLPPKARARHIAFVPQDTALTIGFTAKEVVSMGRYPHRSRWAPESRVDTEKTWAALEAVGATSLADRPVNELSGGQRQLIHIARALAQDSPVLLLDEPVSALDLKHQVAVLELLGDLAEREKAVIVVLHDLNHVGRWCDRAVLLNDGSIVAQGKVNAVLTKDALEETYGIDLSVEPHPLTGALTVTPHPYHLSRKVAP